MGIEIKSLYKKSPKRKRNKFIMILFNLGEVIINSFIPFICGFYLSRTETLLWLLPFIFVILFNFRIFRDKEGYKFELVRF